MLSILFPPFSFLLIYSTELVELEKKKEEVLLQKIQLVEIAAFHFMLFVVFKSLRNCLWVHVKTCAHSPSIANLLWFVICNFELRAAASLPLYHLPRIRQRKHQGKDWIYISELHNMRNKEDFHKTLMSERKTNTLEKVSDSLLQSC